MKMSCFFYILVVFLSCKTTKVNNDTQSIHLDEKWLWEWIESWDFIAKKVFDLSDEADIPKILFYDEKYVITNSSISAPQGFKINGPGLYGKDVIWKKQLHNDTLILPDGKKTNVQLMTFAAPMTDGSYFVMPAPEYWSKAGLQSKIVTTNQMLNGIFVHEFAHTRQMKYLSEILIRFSESGSYKYPVNDDIIQNYFKNDSIYARKFIREIEDFYNILDIEDHKEFIRKAKEAVTAYRNRQEHFLKPVSKKLIEMDDVFLTMEGIGQYAMLKHYMKKGGLALSFTEALVATRQNKKWWSQEEGLALILVYEKLVNKIEWQQLFYMDNITLIDLIEMELKKYP